MNDEQKPLTKFEALKNLAKAIADFDRVSGAENLNGELQAMANIFNHVIKKIRAKEENPE